MKTFLIGLLFAFIPSVAFAQTETVEATRRAWPNGNATMAWEFDQAKEAEIDGFYILRASRTSSNMNGVLGPFSRVATLSKIQRVFTLSAPVGTYVYQVVSYKGSKTSVAANQVRVVFIP